MLHTVAAPIKTPTSLQLNAADCSRRDALWMMAAAALAHPLPGALGSDKDSLPMQFFKSLTEPQRQRICLPINDPKRDFISNWWYVCPEERLHTFFTPDQQDLVKQIFESLHAPDFREKMTWQVQKDLMGNIKNTPSVAFFGTPHDPDFEFIYTGHHVTRRCNAHTDQGRGFGKRPLFYGNFAKAFRESKDHEGNPFWYQGVAFNNFVSTLEPAQRALMLVDAEPRTEKPSGVIVPRSINIPGLPVASLSKDQQATLLKTMRNMLACFRADDVNATIQTIEQKNILSSLFISCYGGDLDIGGDGVWDVWQIEGPNLVWYFRGAPHIHGYFHLNA
jgi:hypothetical protein